MPSPARRTTCARVLLAFALSVGMTCAMACGMAVATAGGAAAAPIGGAELTGTGVVYHVPKGVPKPPAMPAKGYLLADLSTGQILVAKDPHGRFLPASTLKILTALTLLPRLDPSQVYRAKAADMNMDGTRVGIVAGSTYTVHKLFQGLLMSSGNDAANALANAAGGVRPTVALMQKEADALGARDTTVGDPSGLDAPGQRTSAYDLALFSRAAMKRADFRSYVATKVTVFPGAKAKGKRHKGFEIQNHNRLLTEYKGAIGIKPGYTDQARWTFVGAARRGSHTYLVAEMRLKQQGWRPTMKLLDWAFKHGSQATPVGRLVDPGEVDAQAAPPAAVAPTAAAAGSGTTQTLATGSSAGSDRWLGGLVLGGAAVIIAGVGVTLVRSRRRA